jgi:hypothetical protein
MLDLIFAQQFGKHLTGKDGTLIGYNNASADRIAQWPIPSHY